MTRTPEQIARFDARHLDGIFALCNAEQWPDLPADPVRARIDLLAEPGSEPFYDTMPHRELRGYRLYPQPDQ